MGVERVDYYSDDEYQQASHEERLEEERQREREQQPEVVPCPVCGGQMWEMQDICDICMAKKNDF
jgi:rubrerythrin